MDMKALEQAMESLNKETREKIQESMQQHFCLMATLTVLRCLTQESRQSFLVRWSNQVAQEYQAQIDKDDTEGLRMVTEEANKLIERVKPILFSKAG